MLYVFLFLSALIPLLADRGLVILDNLYHTDYVSIGGEIEGCLALMNTSDEPIRVKVYPKDFIFNLTKETIFLDVGGWKRSNAAWVDTKYNYLEIPPFTACPFEYMVCVPKDSSLQGSYWSVLMFESSEPQKTRSSPDGTEVKVIKRFAFQIVTQVGDKGFYNLRVLDKRVELLGVEKKLVFDIENTGTLSMKVKPFVELLNEKGELLNTYPGEQRLLHPLCSAKFDVDITSVKRGAYKARFILRQGNKSIFSTEYPVEIPDALQEGL